MWKKVLYVGFTLIIAIVVFFLGYYSNQFNHLYGLVNSAIEEKNYAEVVKIFDVCFDTKSKISDDSDKLDIVLYPAVSDAGSNPEITYGTENDMKKYNKFEKVYYLYIFNPKYSYSDVSTGSDSAVNKTGIRFNGESSSYDYYYIVNENYNSSEYKANPATLSEAILNNQRNLTGTVSSMNFMRFTLTETMVKEIETKLGSTITSFEILDSTGATDIYKSDVALDYKDKFFTDINDLIVERNEYLNILQTTDDSEKINAANEKFSLFFNGNDQTKGWLAEFEENTATTGYSFHYDSSYLTPSSLIWQTIGMDALFIVFMILLYVVLFHFSAIRRIFSRSTYKNYKDDDVIVNGKKQKLSELNKTPKATKKENIIEVKEETSNEATSEAQKENTENKE